MTTFNIGFTGTSHELKEHAYNRLRWEMEALVGLDAKCPKRSEFWAHSGDCIVADAAFHSIAVALGWKTRGHIPIKDEKRAFCKYDVENEPLNYFGRNRTIVHASEIMFATPGRMHEEQKGGTWYTINYARKQNSPLTIIWPDGTVTRERWNLVE